MTENEVKIFMKIEKECINRNCDRNCAHCDIVQKVEDLNNAYDTAIKALEEVQQYRETGLTPAQVRTLQMDFTGWMQLADEYRTIGTVEECRRNKDFLDFLSDKMNPNDFETYLSMYNSSGEKAGEVDAEH